MNTSRNLSSTFFSVLLLAGLGTLPLVAADFDSDGYADLAVGTPHENVGSDVSQMQAGAVSTIYGSGSGLTTTGNQYWTENLNLDGVSEGSDHLGTTLAAGDFDNDGYIDLVIGVPDEDVGSVINAGKVNVVYGTASGLAEPGNQSWHENSAGMDWTDSEDSDAFGSSLAVGDFNGDGYDDLAVGVPKEDVGSATDAGAVDVIFGSPSGLSTTFVADIWLRQSMVDGTVEAGNQFGFSVAAGDFDNDGYDDLAVGAPYDDMPNSPTDTVDAGTVNIAWGASLPFVDRVSLDLWHQDRSGIPDEMEDNDQFGYSLITGDFDKDGYDDLAIGVPFEDCGTVVKSNAGAVHVLFGSSTGISSTSSHYFHQDSASVGGATEVGDRFGEVLGAGDFDGNGYSDLVVGVPYDSVTDGSDWEDAGLIHVFFGGIGGLEVPDQLITAHSLATDGSSGTEHMFGYAVAAGDFDGDGDDDLAVGAPGHVVGSFNKAGLVFVLPGVPAGLSLTNQTFSQGGGGMIGTNETNDRFGKALVAIPRGDEIFSDGFESGGTTRWSITVD